ncbi:hypothetical protein BD560DRAFT_407175 [Blakeslea trispora]|nr:hypothetical protein BD560DRAFT_407175 [Blakeslea trispora]
MSSAQLTCPYCNINKRQHQKSKNLAFCSRCQSTYITQPLKAWDSDIEEDDGHSIYIPTKTDTDNDSEFGYSVYSLETPISTRSQLKELENQKKLKELSASSNKGIFSSFSRRKDSLSPFTEDSSSGGSLRHSSPIENNRNLSTFSDEDEDEEEKDIFDLRQRKNTTHRPSMNLTKQEYDTMFETTKEDKPMPKIHTPSVFDAFLLSSDSESEEPNQPKEKSPPIIPKSHLFSQLNMFSDDDDDDVSSIQAPLKTKTKTTKPSIDCNGLLQQKEKRFKFDISFSDSDDDLDCSLPTRPKKPKFEIPEFKIPEFKRPEFKMPEFKRPKFKTPEFKRPELKRSKSIKSEFIEPETNKFEFTSPKLGRPESNRSNSSRSESSRFEFSRSELKRPRSIKAESIEPESSRFELTRPGSIRSEFSRSKVKRPEPKKPASKDSLDDLPAIFSDIYIPKPTKERQSKPHASDPEFSDFEDMDFEYKKPSVLDARPDLSSLPPEDQFASIVRGYRSRDRVVVSDRSRRAPNETDIRITQTGRLPFDSDDDSIEEEREKLRYMDSMRQQKKTDRDYRSQLVRLYEPDKHDIIRPEQSRKHYSTTEKSLLRQLLRLQRKRPVHQFNPFILFNSKIRKQLSEENPDLTMKELSILVGQAWRGLDEQAKKKFVEEANNKRNLFYQSGGTGSAMKLRRPPNGYCLFSKDNVRRIRREHPDAVTVNLASKYIAEEWRALDPKIKEEYDKKAFQLWQQWKERAPDEFERYKAQLKHPSNCKY